MTIAFSYLSWPFINSRDDVEKYQKLAQLVEASGFTAFGVADTQYRRAESYVGVTLAASVTRRILVGPCPSNPITREPSVTAAFLATIDAISEGRAMLAMATGNTAAYSAGRRPATRARLEEYIQAVRDIISTGESEFNGRISRVKRSPDAPRKRIPIYIVAGGPKTLRLAGRIGDGVILGNGVLPEVVEHSLEMIAAGAAEAGRRLDDIDLWWVVQPGLASTAEEARESIKASITGQAYHSFRHNLDEKQVPNHLRSAVERYVAEHDYLSHGQEQGRNFQLMDQLGLTDYFLERLSIVGTSGDWIKKINALGAIGVQKLWLSPFPGGLDRELQGIEALSRKVLPEFLDERLSQDP